MHFWNFFCSDLTVCLSLGPHLVCPSHVFYFTPPGVYIQNQKAGAGVMAFANGDVYDGEWEGDAMHGAGTYRSAQRPTHTSQPWGISSLDSVLLPTEAVKD